MTPPHDDNKEETKNEVVTLDNNNDNSKEETKNEMVTPDDTPPMMTIKRKLRTRW